ncbi:MAG: hypothetical protein LBI03_08275 [Clostridiales bacterium]|jgi:hypothetical protein|nr:hypothetical protein [Clostridiales bacterium]
MYKKIITVFTILFVMLLCFAGCKPSELSPPPPSVPADVALKDSLEKFSTYDSFKANLNLTMNISDQEITLTGFFNEDIKDENMYFELNMGSLGVTTQIKCYVKDNSLYMLLPASTKYIQYDLTSLNNEMPIQTPEDGSYDDVFGNIKDEFNTEDIISKGTSSVTVNGSQVNATNYEYVIDSEKLNDILSTLIANFGVGDLSNLISFGGMNFDWSISDEGNLVKMDMLCDTTIDLSSMNNNLDGMGSEADGSNLKSDCSIDFGSEFYDFNLPSNIEFPEFNDSNTETFSGDIQSMIGSLFSMNENAPTKTVIPGDGSLL